MLQIIRVFGKTLNLRRTITGGNVCTTFLTFTGIIGDDKYWPEVTVPREVGMWV